MELLVSSSNPKKGNEVHLSSLESHCHAWIGKRRWLSAVADVDRDCEGCKEEDFGELRNIGVAHKLELCAGDLRSVRSFLHRFDGARYR
jgi:hypothetical protein